MPEEKKIPVQEGMPDVQPPVLPTVTEVQVDPYDRGTREGYPLPEQTPGHTRAETPPKQVDPSDETHRRMVHIPSLISDEFGTPRNDVRREMAQGQVLLDGEAIVLENGTDIPYDELLDKEIHVIGEVKHYKVHYRG